MDVTKILGSPKDMLNTIFDKMSGLGLPTTLPCDHLCYRVANWEKYTTLKDAITEVATLESEAMISGRPICTFRLHTPITHGSQTIDCIELPAPKVGSNYKEGWEHAEFVTGMIPGLSPRVSLEAFLAQFQDRLPFDTRSLEKDLNPEIGLKLDGTPYQIKFHPRPLLQVVALEKNLTPA